MTIHQLVKRLEEIRAAHGNAKVGVDWESFRSECDPSDATIGNVETVEYESLHVMDPDGGVMVNKDGSERMIRMVVLRAGD